MEQDCAMSDEGVSSWTSKRKSSPEKQTKAEKIFPAINWDEIIEACMTERACLSGLDPDTNKRIPCSIMEHWSMGLRSMVVEARFKDSVRWAIKISMPSLRGLDGSSEPKPSSIYEAEKAFFQDELTAMAFIKYVTQSISCLSGMRLTSFYRKHTKIPIATAYFTKSIQTSLGPSVILAMELIPGIMGTAYFSPRLSNYSGIAQERVREIQNNILRSLAEVQIMLASYSSPLWGRLGKQGGTEPGVKHHLVDGYVAHCWRERSYRRPMAFYKANYPLVARKLDSADIVDSCTVIESIIRANLPHMHDATSTFYLTNNDIGAHNAIFNSQGELQAIIDVDGLIFAPIETAAQAPQLVGLSTFPISENRTWRPPHGSGISYLEEYADMLREAGKTCGHPLLGEKFASQLLSDSAVLVAGLYISHVPDPTIHADWLSSPVIQRLQAFKPQGLLSRIAAKLSTLQTSKAKSEPVVPGSSGSRGEEPNRELPLESCHNRVLAVAFNSIGRAKSDIE